MSKQTAQHCNYPRCSCKATGVYCDQRKVSGPKPKKAIPKRSAKGIIKALDKSKMFKNDALFYFDIWQERAHIDFETSLQIHGELLTFYFHHVLPKRPDGGYPQYRHCKWNIVLLSWQTHTNAENNLDLVPKVKAYTEKLLAMHEKGLLAKADPEKHFI